MNKLLQDIYIKLSALIEHTDVQDEKRTINYLRALLSHIDAINREKDFVLSEEQLKFLKRRQVVWVDFGFNIGEEFGGKHPAIILRTLSNNKSITVIPIDGQSCDPEVERHRKSYDYWVQIPHINGMSSIPRWVNVYRVKEVSTIRVDFSKSHGASIPIDTLKVIDEHIEKYRYKPNYEQIVKKQKNQKSFKNHLTNRN